MSKKPKNPEPPKDDPKQMVTVRKLSVKPGKGIVEQIVTVTKEEAIKNGWHWINCACPQCV